MKKGKVLTKGQITVGVLVLGLALAVWLNAKYVPTSTKYLGDAVYVDATENGEAVETAAKVDTGDYFATAKKERENARKEASDTVEELLKTDKLTEKDKKEIMQKIENINKNIQTEADIETLLKAKGFEKCLVIINDKGITVIVKSDGLNASQTMQIQDIVTTETSINLQNLKIIPIAK